MPCLPFDAMPDTARVWIFPATRALSAAEGQRVLAETDAFIAGWAAHGVPLTAARDLRHERFLMVAADEAAEGCRAAPSTRWYGGWIGSDRRSASTSSSTGLLLTATAERSAMCRGIASRLWPPPAA